MTWLFAGIALGLFLWAFVEAYAWPVVPDVALASAVFLVPEGAAMFVTSTVAGSIIGGVTALMAHRAGWRWPLPLVSGRMEAEVARWLDKGPSGLIHQPLTAVPYKAFVVEGARRGFPGSTWAWWTGLLRGARMAAVTLVTVIATRAIALAMPSHTTGVRLLVLAAGLIVFAVGWAAAWRLWADAPEHATTRVRTRTMQP